MSNQLNQEKITAGTGKSVITKKINHITAITQVKNIQNKETNTVIFQERGSK